jgi:hypothetical protein
MSYLEMATSQLPDMNKGIISLWFRDATKGAAPAPDPWPSGLWAPGTASMVPPDVVGIVKKEEFYPWNAYGLFISGGGIQLPIFGPAAVMMPYPPPFVTDGMHMMLTFGNPKQTHFYSDWQQQFPDVIQGVVYVPMLIPGPQWSVPHDPPPYKPWIQQYGKFKVVTMVLAGARPKANFVPQSFIGLDKDGYLTICLQTANRANYRGYAFEVNKVTEIWATATYFDAPPHLSLGPGHWVKVPGYWDGYQYEYRDISNQVMAAAPEMFVIGGPPAGFEFQTVPKLRDGAWHHVLFSFDISQSVNVSWPGLLPGGTRPKPSIQGTAKAWLAVDGINYKGIALQHRFAMHDGFQLPLLPGMGTDAVGFGPVTSATRDIIGLGNDNNILPANAWIIGLRGAPKDGLPQFSSSAGLWEAESTQYINKGDFNFFSWTGSIWTLEGSGGKETWAGSLDPPRPTVPDPKTFDVPTYSCSGFSLPVNGHPIGVPVANRHLKHNTGIEMAELQIWANQTIDTADAIGLFIKDGKPAPLKRARERLGRPDVLLHGSSNWKAGRNTGKAGMSDDGRIIAQGQFKPVAAIERFTPNPQLGK